MLIIFPERARLYTLFFFPSLLFSPFCFVYEVKSTSVVYTEEREREFGLSRVFPDGWSRGAAARGLLA